MTGVEFLFWAIDGLFHIPQNYIKKKGVKAIKNIAYGDDKLQKLDIYIKETGEPLPVVFNVHGGGFVKGDKKHRKTIGHLFADKGFAVVNINYRLAPKNVFPACVTDAMLALNYTNDVLAKQFNLDMSRVILTGDSSGAYISAYMTALIANKELAQKMDMIPETKIKPAGFIGMCGPYDIITSLKAKVPFKIVPAIMRDFLGFKPKKDLSNVNDYKYIKELSPADYANANWCPTLLGYAKKDLFCEGHAEVLLERLKKFGVNVTGVSALSRLDNHCYHFNYWTKSSKNTFNVIYNFLEQIKSNRFDEKINTSEI